MSDFVTIWRIAAGVTTPIGIVALAVAAWLRISMQRSERSIRDEIAGANIISPGAVLDILKTFKEDKERNEALKAMLGDQKSQLKEVTKLVKGGIDTTLRANEQTARRFPILVITGVFLLMFAALSLAIGSQSANKTSADPTGAYAPDASGEAHSFASVSEERPDAMLIADVADSGPQAARHESTADAGRIERVRAPTTPMPSHSVQVGDVHAGNGSTVNIGNTQTTGPNVGTGDLTVGNGSTVNVGNQGH
jgi:hypothetical protein